MTTGYIYILSNNSYINNLYKVGKTTRLPKQRIQELNKETGVPESFNIVHIELSQNVHDCEKEIHNILNEYRVSKKEFFKAPLELIKSTVRDVCDRANITTETKKRTELDLLVNQIQFDGLIVTKYEIDKLYKLRDLTENENLKIISSFIIGQYLSETQENHKALIELDYVEAYLDRFPILHINSSSFWNAKAKCYLAMSKFMKAAYCLSFYGDPTLRILKRGECFLKSGHIDQAIKEYQSLKQKNDLTLNLIIDERMRLLAMLDEHQYQIKKKLKTLTNL